MKKLIFEIKVLLGLAVRFTPPKGFKVPKGFPQMRMKSILVKKENDTDLTKAKGLFLPSSMASINKFVGRLYAVGPDASCKDIKPGMRVIFNALADQTIMFDGVEYKFMSSIDIFAVLPEGVDTFTNNIAREGRKQHSIDEMPKSEPDMDEIEALKEIDREQQRKNNVIFTDKGKTNDTQ